MPLRKPLPAALRRRAFRRLFTVRLAAQFGDGVFQAGLAATVLFNPERQASAADVAAGFAVVLLPYSLVGPFAGVLLDRWDRQRVLLFGGLVRAGLVLAVAAEIAAGLTGLAFYASALAVLSVSRFVLSALSAALPHVVADAELAAANALTTTVGTLATTLGGGSAVLARLLTGSGSAGYAALAALAALPYLLSSLLAQTLRRGSLGPGQDERAGRESVREVLRGLRAGLAHVRSRPGCAGALTVVGVHRLCYGIWAVCTVLLYRNRFADAGVLRAGLPGLTQFVFATAVGAAAAAVITPRLSRRVGPATVAAALLAAAGAVVLGCGLPCRLPLQLVGGALLGICAQGVKICVDTILQRGSADAFRGRVFTLYDTLFNAALVAAAAITATALPGDGRSPVAFAGVGIAYLLAAAAYGRFSSRTTPARTAAAPTSLAAR